MKAFSLSILMSLLAISSWAQTTLHSNFSAPKALELPKRVLEQAAWTSYWQQQFAAVHQKKVMEKSVTRKDLAIGGSESEMSDFFWLGRYELCTYLAPDTSIHLQIEPLYTSEIPDSLILPVDIESLVSETVERLVFLQDGLVLDSVWLSMHDYFNTWSTTDVNPYQANLADLPDSLVLQLYDEAKAEGWSAPLDTSIVNSHFGLRRWRYHNGIDLDLERGDLVRATFDGVVRISRYNRRGFGHYIVVRHANGLETLYAHLSERFVSPGMYVKAGQLIGTGGSTGRSTGPHLHFEVRYNGIPINPAELFDFKNNTLKAQTFVWDTKSLKRTGRSSSYRTKAVVKKDASGSRVYQVRSGDSLWTISRRHGVSISQLCALNGISRSTTLRIGQKLVLD